MAKAPTKITVENLAIEKTSEQKKKFYIDDLALTQQLMKEKEEYLAGERKTSSEDLARQFIIVLEHVLTKHNFSGYSKNYKDEFRSKAYMLFVKHWFKFKPEKTRLNYYQKDGELYFKEDPTEYRGAFGLFSLFSSTASIDEIKRFKRQREKLKEIVDNKNADLESLDQYLYTT
jgi:hypothetical protein